MDKRITTAADALDRALPLLRAKGQTALERFADWEKAGQVPRNGERGGGLAEGAPEDRLAERREDRKAAGYHAEYRTVLARMEADALRLVFLLTEGSQEQRRKIQGKDMLAAQVAANGQCVSCFRYDNTLKDREKGSDGHFYDKEACRRCAGFKREHGIYPPLSLLEHWHGKGKLYWSTKMVEEALAQTGRKASWRWTTSPDGGH